MLSTFIIRQAPSKGKDTDKKKKRREARRKERRSSLRRWDIYPCHDRLESWVRISFTPSHSQEERCHHHADRVESCHQRRLSGAFLPRCADLYGGANDGLPCCADRRQEHCRRKNRRTDADQIRQQARKQARQRRTPLWWRQHSQHLCRQQTFRAAVRQLTASD